jgi:hypothetical protein
MKYKSMKMNKSILWAFILMIVVSAISRFMVYNVAGFAPQMAIALFGGAVIKDKKWAFALPLASLLLSDIIFQLMFELGLSGREGFYPGQWAVYLCFAMLTVFGFLMKKINLKNVIGFSISGSVLFFLTSNFFVWLGYGGLGRPATFEGLLLCYGDALAYYRDNGLINGFIANSMVGDLIWCSVLFGGYYLLSKTVFAPKENLAQ